MFLALLLTNPDGSPIDTFHPEPSFAQIVGHEAAVAGMIATLGVVFVLAIAGPTRPKHLPRRFPKEFAYLIAATVELWLFALFAPLLLR